MPYPQPTSVHLFRAIARPVVRLTLRLGCRVTLAGMENIPPHGPYIVAVNHLATYDPPMLAAFWPHPLEGITAADQFERFFIGHVFRAYGAIPVHRGEYDREALKKALQVLRAGSPLGIAPEGGRTFKPGLRHAKPGIAYLALKAQVPIVPVGIAGTEMLMPCWRRLRRPRLSLAVGQPFCLPEMPAHKDRRQQLVEYTTFIMQCIADLLPLEYRGVYGSSSLG